MFYEVVYNSDGEKFIMGAIIKAKNEEQAKKYLKFVTLSPENIILEPIKCRYRGLALRHVKEGLLYGDYVFTIDNNITEKRRN